MKKSVLVILCFWLVIIAGFVISQEFTIRTGREVLLKTVPVDPRDLLRGDYVILNYEIAQFDYTYGYFGNETVYVTLKTDEQNVASVDRLLRRKPENALFLKGRVGKCNTVIPFFKTGKCINYGIESYFVKEGTGRALEKDLRNGTLVRVSVDKNGNAKIKGFAK